MIIFLFCFIFLPKVIFEVIAEFLLLKKVIEILEKKSHNLTKSCLLIKQDELEFCESIGSISVRRLWHLTMSWNIIGHFFVWPISTANITVFGVFCLFSWQIFPSLMVSSEFKILLLIIPLANNQTLDILFFCGRLGLTGILVIVYFLGNLIPTRLYLYLVEMSGFIVSKVGDRSRRQTEGSLLISYYTEL